MEKKNKLNKKLKKISRIFPKLRNIEDINLLKIDKVGEYSISIPEDAYKTTKIIKNLSGKIGLKNIVITDATASVGGNTISFSQNFEEVNAIEIDSNRFEYLKNNLNLYNIKNVKLFNSDFLHLIKLVKQDVLFIDPPWGGKDYKSKGEILLNISNISLEKICNDVLEQKISKIVVLKLPINYNIKFFNKKIRFVTHHYKLGNKMNLICITHSKKTVVI